jgi:hypothetical protein
MEIERNGFVRTEKARDRKEGAAERREERGGGSSEREEEEEEEEDRKGERGYARACDGDARSSKRRRSRQISAITVG